MSESEHGSQRMSRCDVDGIEKFSAGVVSNWKEIRKGIIFRTNGSSYSRLYARGRSCQECFARLH